MHTLSSATHRNDQPKVEEPTTSAANGVPLRSPDTPLILKASHKTVTETPKHPELAKNSTRVPTTLSHSRTQDRGVDPVTTTSSVLDLIDAKATAGSQTSSVEGAAYATTRARTTGTDSLYLTASEGLLEGNLCASSTRKKDLLVGDLSIQATKGSRDNSPAASEEGETISPEQLRFTAAISKA